MIPPTFLFAVKTLILFEASGYAVQLTKMCVNRQCLYMCPVTATISHAIKLWRPINNSITDQIMFYSENRNIEEHFCGEYRGLLKRPSLRPALGL